MHKNECDRLDPWPPWTEVLRGKRGEVVSRGTMKAMGIKEEFSTGNRCAWRNITGGPTRASADA